MCSVVSLEESHSSFYPSLNAIPYYIQNFFLYKQQFILPQKKKKITVLYNTVILNILFNI